MFIWWCLYAFKKKGFKLAGVIDLNNEIKASVGDFLFCKTSDDRSYF